MNFNVTAESKKETLKFFSINTLEDFIQKDVVIKDMCIEDGTYGKQLKVTIAKDEAELFGWLCAEPVEEKTIKGKTITLEQQVSTVVKTVGHIGTRFLGDDWVTDGISSYTELLEFLIKETKPFWGKTKFNIKLDFNSKGFPTINRYIPFLEKPTEKTLRISKADDEKLAKQRKITPDSPKELGLDDNSFETQDSPAIF